MSPARRCLAAAVLAAQALGACVTYEAVRPASVVPGQEVRVTIDADRASPATSLVQQEVGRVLAGTVLENGAEGLLVAVPVAVRGQGIQNEVLRQRVRLREDEILTLELRELNRRRTALAVGAGAAATALALTAILTGVVGGSSSAPPNGPEQLQPLPW